MSIKNEKELWIYINCDIILLLIETGNVVFSENDCRRKKDGN